LPETIDQFWQNSNKVAGLYPTPKSAGMRPPHKWHLRCHDKCDRTNALVLGWNNCRIFRLCSRLVNCSWCPRWLWRRLLEFRIHYASVIILITSQ